MSQHYAYRKLRDYVIALILDGHVAEGEALPSVRSLAHARGVNPLTAAKAIYNLPPGTLRPVRGIGNFVAQGAVERLRAAERASFLDERWPQIRAEISRLRFTQTELLGALPQPPARGAVRDRSEAGADPALSEQPRFAEHIDKPASAPRTKTGEEWSSLS